MDKKFIDKKLFTLSPEGLSDQNRKNTLNEFLKYIDVQKKHFLGYQNNFNLNYEDDVKDFLNYSVNNVGDPFVPGDYTINSKEMEKAVLDYYARLWNGKTPHNPEDPESYWGYILTMGSTEGNLYGLWNARDYLAGRKLSADGLALKYKKNYAHPSPVEENPNSYTPVAFFSEDTHYSAIKALRVLNIPSFYEIGKKFFPGQNPLSSSGEWTKEFLEVPSLCGKAGEGVIDVEKLAILVEFFASKGYPAIICCNYGTTFKGAYDDVEAIGERLMPIFEKYGLKDRVVKYDNQDQPDIRNGYWFHVDGALGAAYMPFVEMARKEGRISSGAPVFDFRLPWVNSIVMSGHKWIGSPWPCGIFMTKVKYQLFPPDDPEYIGSPDTSFAGSRNGLSAIVLWDYIARNSYEKQVNKIIKNEELACYAEKQLKTVQFDYIRKDLWIERTPLSLTIRFRKPDDDIVFKYSLSCETLSIGGETRHYAHIYIMDSVTKELIDEFVNDLKSPGAF